MELVAAPNLQVHTIDYVLKENQEPDETNKQTKCWRRKLKAGRTNPEYKSDGDQKNKARRFALIFKV